jgi:hypothetical protein
MNVTIKECMSESLFWKIIGYYLHVTIDIVGSIFNLLCIIIFIKIVKNESRLNSNMFNYLLLKSFLDFLTSFFDIPQAFYVFSNSTFNTSYVIQIWRKYYFYYFSNVFALSSSICEIAASLDCLLLISNNFSYFKKKIVFYVFTVVLNVFSVLFFIPAIFRYEIFKNESSYTIVPTKFKSSTFIRYYWILNYILRDYLTLAILLILNILILVALNRSTQRRKKLKSSQMVQMATRAENSKIKMILFSSLFFLMRIPTVYYNYAYASVGNCFEYIVGVLYISSYALPIVTYILFNKKFKTLFFKFIFCYEC